MALRRAFYHWLLPAAFVLPLWLLVGWGVFSAGGWAFVWTMFIAIPAVFVGQLVFALLVRARPSARYQRAVSWPDAAGFGLWHALTIALGFHPDGAFGWLLTAAIVVGAAMVPLLLWQLWAEARGSIAAYSVHLDEEGLRSSEAYNPKVIVVEESEPVTPPHRAG